MSHHKSNLQDKPVMPHSELKSTLDYHALHEYPASTGTTKAATNLSAFKSKNTLSTEPHSVFSRHYEPFSPDAMSSGVEKMKELQKAKDLLKQVDPDTTTYHKALEVNYDEFRLQERDTRPARLTRDGAYWQGQKEPRRPLFKAITPQNQSPNVLK